MSGVTAFPNRERDDASECRGSPLDGFWVCVDLLSSVQIRARLAATISAMGES